MLLCVFVRKWFGCGIPFRERSQRIYNDFQSDSSSVCVGVCVCRVSSSATKVSTNFLCGTSWKSTRKVMEVEDEQEEYEVDVFCKNKNRLIKVERNAEFYPVDTYINSSISMQCKFCEEQDDGLPKNWNRQKHIFTGNITEVELSMSTDSDKSKVFVSKIHSLIIRNVQEKDMGLYFCKAPFVDKLEKSYNYLVDIMNRSSEDIKGNMQGWKNYSETYLKPLNERFATEDVASINYMKINITVYTDWSEWSECDACSTAATRFRIGRCRVKPVCDDPSRCFDKNLSENDTFFDEKHNTEESATEASNSTEIEIVNPNAVQSDIIQFSIALSCKSLLLKKLLPEVFKETSHVPDFILRSNCTGPCKGRMSKKGARYKRSIILTQGAHLTLVCPDSSIDSEVKWEHNKRRLYPNEGFDYVPGSEEPRVYVDSFNTLYLFEVTDEESGNYTCYVNGIQMQEVKIIVLKRSVFFTKEFRRHLNYLAIVFLLCFIAYMSGITLFCVRRNREERSRGPKRRAEESEKLLDDYESN